MEKIDLSIMLRNKGATAGAVWAELSMVGYVILYPQYGGQYNSLLYKLLFLFILILDKVERAISPTFSFPYTLVYTSRSNVLLFIFILGIGGVVGGFIGAGAEYIIGNTAGYISEHQKPTIKKATDIILKVHEKVGHILKNARELIPTSSKKER